MTRVPQSPNEPGPKTIANLTWDDVTPRRKDIPEGLWMRCPFCESMQYRKAVEDNLNACPSCDTHFRISAERRIAQLCDDNSFEQMFADVEPTDPLKFKDRKAYKQRLKDEQKKTGRPDAVITGKGYVKGRAVALAVMDPDFMMGSMGSVVGEKITALIEVATDAMLPLVIVTCSGGARMQEGVISLTQMAKTSAALGRYDDAGGLFVSILADPTTGGVAASFAMLGDVIIAEPKALIGFAGPRTIWHTIKVELPEGFQRAEFLLEHGFVDMIVPRQDLRSQIARLIDYGGK